MKRFCTLFFLALAAFLPFGWRLVHHGLQQPLGLLSDAGTGLFIFLLAFYSPHWLRLLLMLLWVILQLVSHELQAAMQRMLSWQDFHYFTDGAFVANTTSGLNFAVPVLALLFAVSTLVVILLPIKKSHKPRKRYLVLGLVMMLGLFASHHLLNLQGGHEDSMAARYNGVHWLLRDATFLLTHQVQPVQQVILPPGLNELDLSGKALLTDSGRAKNVLIVILEGIPGLYYPEIRQAMGFSKEPPVNMHSLTKATHNAMLVPDFTAHSHQTVRGLYAILCGDYSKLSWDTAKAFELASYPGRAEECLPAQLAQQGWSTHYLQAAGLSFMGKDRFMPLIGFEETHGVEWFTEANPYPFPWGAVDTVFFRGAREYIRKLQADAGPAKKPWMLTLLTVGTHQPYAVPEEIVAKYPSRLVATVVQLDQSVGKFLDQLRADGLLEDTLVIVTSDESHGSELGDWISSWGLGIVMTPEKTELPRIKSGGYGLVDIEASVLDYLQLNVPPNVIGRSFFRDYTTPREMVAFTTSKLRHHTAGNLRYECATDGLCLVGPASSLLGVPKPELLPDKSGQGAQLFAIAERLDQSLDTQENDRLLHFGQGDIRRLPEKITDEWADNLTSAQYLKFPAKSTVQVNIRITALNGPPEGIQLRLVLKQWEGPVAEIEPPVFPLLHQGEEAQVNFSFSNPTLRDNFSFHLLGEGKDSSIRIDEFDVLVSR